MDGAEPAHRLVTDAGDANDLAAVVDRGRGADGVAAQRPQLVRVVPVRSRLVKQSNYRSADAYDPGV